MRTLIGGTVARPDVFLRPLRRPPFPGDMPEPRRLLGGSDAAVAADAAEAADASRRAVTAACTPPGAGESPRGDMGGGEARRVLSGEPADARGEALFDLDGVR